MPINLSKFEDEGEEVTGKPRAARKEQVEDFLKQNAKQAYTQKEVASALKMNPTQARSVLMGLLEDGIVDRKMVDNGKRVLIYYAYAGEE